jgi:hypothetical protein
VLPQGPGRAAALRLAEPSAAGQIALMPAGSGDRSLYPSVRSWLAILDALTDAFPGIRIALIGKHRRDTRTATSFAARELADFLAHRSRPLGCFDAELAEQHAVVEASDLFLAPHTGFGMAALAVGTPWLALSGGPWFEYFFNRVPFRSIVPDGQRYPSFSQFAPGFVIDDDRDGRRTPSMTTARVREDLDRIVAAARELLDGSLTYEQSLTRVGQLVRGHTLLWHNQLPDWLTQGVANDTISDAQLRQLLHKHIVDEVRRSPSPTPTCGPSSRIRPPSSRPTRSLPRLRRITTTSCSSGASRFAAASRSPFGSSAVYRASRRLTTMGV